MNKMLLLACLLCSFLLEGFFSPPPRLIRTHSTPDIPEESVATSHPVISNVIEIEDFDYSNIANFANHLISVRPRYTSVRHLWHYCAVIDIILEQSPITEIEYYENIRSVMLSWQIQLTQEHLIHIDIQMIQFLDKFFGNFQATPFPFSQFDIIQHQMYPGITIKQAYESRLGFWYHPYCILDLLARNYLVYFYVIASNINLFDKHKLYTVTEKIYTHVYKYERFKQCGTLNLYNNCLAKADILCDVHL